MKTRPAETTTLAGAIGGLIAYIAGLDSEEATIAIIALVGVLPAAVTTLVNVGGIKGAANLLLRGRR